MPAGFAPRSTHFTPRQDQKLKVTSREVEMAAAGGGGGGGGSGGSRGIVRERMSSEPLPVKGNVTVRAASGARVGPRRGDVR